MPSPSSISKDQHFFSPLIGSETSFSFCPWLPLSLTTSCDLIQVLEWCSHLPLSLSVVSLTSFFFDASPLVHGLCHPFCVWFGNSSCHFHPAPSFLPKVVFFCPGQRFLLYMTWLLLFGPICPYLGWQEGHYCFIDQDAQFPCIALKAEPSFSDSQLIPLLGAPASVPSGFCSAATCSSFYTLLIFYMVYISASSIVFPQSQFSAGSSGFDDWLCYFFVPFPWECFRMFHGLLCPPNDMRKKNRIFFVTHV